MSLLLLLVAIVEHVWFACSCVCVCVFVCLCLSISTAMICDPTGNVIVVDAGGGCGAVGEGVGGKRVTLVIGCSK